MALKNNIGRSSFTRFTIWTFCYFWVIERSFEETFEKGKYEGHPSRYDADKSIIISSEAIPEYCNHQWDEGTVKTEATCEEKGEMIYTCTLCGETKTEEIQALGHDWSEWEVLKEAGCTEPGVQSRECARCKKIENEDIPALGHDYVTTIIKEATWASTIIRFELCESHNYRYLCRHTSYYYAMERTYINEFHKQWIESTMKSIAFWKKQPTSSEEAKLQQEMLKRQRAIRENKLKS